MRVLIPGASDGQGGLQLFRQLCVRGELAQLVTHQLGPAMLPLLPSGGSAPRIRCPRLLGVVHDRLQGLKGGMMIMGWWWRGACHRGNRDRGRCLLQQVEEGEGRWWREPGSTVTSSCGCCGDGVDLIQGELSLNLGQSEGGGGCASRSKQERCELAARTKSCPTHT